jgi:Second Messenger Oligonucleotide or Dinucleotide Synthetase domain
MCQYWAVMAKTVDDAFDEFLSWLVPSATETASAQSHRRSIEQCLQNNFGMTSFFRSGSFGYGTSISSFSDVDYFAVMPTNKLTQDSNSTLNNVAQALRSRFPNTAIHVSSPAVVVPFGSSLSERHEIIPADHVSTLNGFNIHDIPDRNGGWMRSSPTFYGRYVDGINDRLSKRVKPLIRLVKAWKYHARVPIRSFYIEMRVAEYAATQQTIIQKHDVRGALAHMVSQRLGAMADPLGLPAPIYAAFQTDIQVAWSKLIEAAGFAADAINAESNGNIQAAFRHWDKVFNGSFPAYY